MHAAELAAYLGARDMVAVTAESLVLARERLKRQHIDIVFLDLGLGEHAGLAFAREVAESGGPPLVIASSRVDESDRVLGLELGADDYLVKPYSVRELLARLKVVIRRSRGVRRAPLARRVAKFGRWTLDMLSLRLTDQSGHDVTITGGEMGLLKVFLEHPDRVLPRQRLISLTRLSDVEVFDRSIDVLVGRLRRRIEDDPKRPRLILTVRGEGYRFSAPVSWTSDTG